MAATTMTTTTTMTTRGRRRLTFGGLALQVLLVLCVLAQQPRRAQAVTCESFTDAAQCDATTTASGKCGWADGACALVDEGGLGDGVFGITSMPGTGSNSDSDTTAESGTGVSGGSQQSKASGDGESEGGPNSSGHLAGLSPPAALLLGACLLLLSLVL